MRVYVVERNSPFWELGKRVSALHNTVYHGVGYYPMIAFPDLDWHPAVTNDNRELLHIARSGRFLPAVFGSSFTFLVVSPEVRKALSSLENVGFNDVVFEQLVDLPMPELGDFSWYKRKDTRKYDHHPDNFLQSRPHVPEFEKRVEGYRQLLPANYQNIAKDYTDVEFVTPDFGSYARVSSIGTYADLKENSKIPVSKKMLEKYPIIQTPHFLFREDAFAAIAPFLDLDYYAIAVIVFSEPAPHVEKAIEDIERYFGISPDDEDE